MPAFLDQLLLTIQAFVSEHRLIVAFSGGLASASLVWAWWLSRRLSRETAAAFEDGLTRTAEEQARSVAVFEERLDLRTQEAMRAQAALDALERQLTVLRESLDERSREVAESRAGEAALTARIEQAEKGFREKEVMFRETSEQLKREFELLANRVLDKQTQSQQERLATVLGPFKEQMGDFRRKVEEVYLADTRERASLLAEIKNLKHASERINAEAENLARALKGDKKLQGNWGEMVLERVLEDSGLRRDHEYFVQASRRSEHGELKRPDVLIRLPDNKDIVVDAKVSLVAYEQALSSEDDAVRERGLKQHVQHVRSHVKRLADQDYDKLKEVRSLDFVLLFVPIESAFTLCMERDPRMFSDAFEKRIVIVSPTTLMMTLRIINNVWRYDKQNKNAKEIARRAGALYDKLRGLVEEMEQLGRQLGTAEKTWESAFGKLTEGKGNLVRQVEQFRGLGATVKKPMSKALLEKAGADEGDNSADPASSQLAGGGADGGTGSKTLLSSEERSKERSEERSGKRSDGQSAEPSRKPSTEPSREPSGEQENGGG